MGLKDAVRYAATLTQSVNVGVSLGKDSVCLLDLCIKNFRDVHPFFMYFVKGLEFQETYLLYLEKRYGIKIRRVPHWMLGDCYRYGLYREPNYITDQSPTINITDVEDYLSDETGCVWFAYGQMICESLERNAMIKSVGEVDEENHRIYALAEWCPSKVKQYLKLHKIELAPEYKYLSRSIGDLRPENTKIIREHFPEDYEIIKRIFPYIEAQEKRNEFERQRKAAEKNAERELAAGNQ